MRCLMISPASMLRALRDALRAPMAIEDHCNHARFKCAVRMRTNGLSNPSMHSYNIDRQPEIGRENIED